MGDLPIKWRDHRGRGSWTRGDTRANLEGTRESEIRVRPGIEKVGRTDRGHTGLCLDGRDLVAWRVEPRDPAVIKGLSEALGPLCRTRGPTSSSPSARVLLDRLTRGPSRVPPVLSQVPLDVVAVWDTHTPGQQDPVVRRPGRPQ